jgi:predicted RNase H-like HicB family nuclease
MQAEYDIKAMWDPEASVWVASSEQIPGLCTEAETLEVLIKKLKTMVPELLHANSVAFPPQQLSFHIVSERTETVKV